jgi:hypothetical protein
VADVGVLPTKSNQKVLKENFLFGLEIEWTEKPSETVRQY